MGDQFECPHCGQLYALTREQSPRYAGQTIDCTSCGESFTVPGEVAGDVAPVRAAPLPPPAPAQAPPPVFEPAVPIVPAVVPPMPMPMTMAASMPTAPQALTAGSPPPSPTNTPAAASLVLALVGLIIPIVCSLAAIALGFAGLLKAQNARVPGRGAALAGVILGFVGLALGIFILSVAIPLAERLHERGQSASCEAHLRAIGDAMLRYAAANDGRFPDRLESLADGALAASDAFACPLAGTSSPVATLPDGRQVSYHYVGGKLTTSAPPEAVLMYEPLDHHGRKGMHVLFTDGRVNLIREIEAAKASMRLAAGQNPPWTGTE